MKQLCRSSASSSLVARPAAPRPLAAGHQLRGAPLQQQLLQDVGSNQRRAAVVVRAGFGKVTAPKLSKQKACPCGSGSAYKVRVRPAAL